MRFISFFLKPTRRKRAVSIAAITAASIVAAIALILWLLLDAGSMGVLRGEYYFEEHQLHLSVDGQEKIFSPVIAPPAAQVILPQAPRTVPSAKSGASVQRNRG